MRKLYTVTSMSSSNPAWSPDGRTIALLDGGKIILIDVATAAIVEHQPLNLTHIWLPYWLAWSRAAERLVFTSQEHNTILTVRPDGFGGRVLAEGRYPCWSPDGSDIALFRDGSLFLVPRYGGATRFLAKAGATTRPASWSPSGNHIAFVGASHWISITSRQGNDARQIAEPEWYGWGDNVAWSPCTEEYIAISQAADIARVFLIEPSGVVLETLEHFANPSWSFDGKKLVGLQAHRESAVIAVINIEDGRRQNLPEASFACWSPTENKLCLTSKGSIFVTDV